MIRRRTLLAAATSPWLAACERPAAEIAGGWVGADAQRGHALRERTFASADGASTRRVSVAIVGSGVAGLAAARALRRAGIDDLRLFELEDAAGGNARGHVLGGMRCPLGAHYLPVPGPHATEVSEWLHELGLLRADPLRPGHALADERQLCHAPQERVFLEGQWHDGLLPLDGAPPATLRHVRRFADDIAALQATLSFTQPTLKSRWSTGLDALDQQTFAAWLDARGHAEPALRTYLDYCCRDDYGAGADMVSAWAGIHYFASRHGFRAPGAPGDAVEAGENDAVFTWPEGNAHLAERLADGLGERLQTAAVVTRIAPSAHAVTLDVWDAHAAQAQRWTAQQVLVCVPLFIAARLIDAPPPALAALAGSPPRIAYAPWLVTNLLLREPLLQRVGPPASWDNVIAGSPALGYVDAMHQSLRPVPGPTVLTHYWALGGQSLPALQANRQRLLQAPWSTWRDAVLADLAPAHPDLAAKVVQADGMRYGHAMCIPTPGLRSDPALRALAEPQGRLHFAHADLSACSAFEEAFTHGTLAGERVAARLHG